MAEKIRLILNEKVAYPYKQQPIRPAIKNQAEIKNRAMFTTEGQRIKVGKSLIQRKGHNDSEL